MLALLLPLRAALRCVSFVALTAIWTFAPASAEDAPRPKPPTPDRSADSEIARYCGALAPSASEARAAYQLRRLADLGDEVREELEKLEKKEAAAREWVTRREAMMKNATDDVVAIYSKMTAEAAAAQMADMDEVVAAAVLAKLKAGAASNILAEMPADKAARLSTLLAGALSAEKS